MICCVIANRHAMVGLDLHEGFPALVPLPCIPFAPHVVFALMVRGGPWWMAGPSENHDISMPPGHAMAKIFDIGMFIPHITLPALNHFVYMLLYTLASASQGHFGVAHVLTPKGPIAVALMLFVNPQLNCDHPLPLPTGQVIAPNTVVACMTFGDFLAGVFSMVLTSAVTWAFSKVVGWAMKGLGALSNKLINGLIQVLPPRITMLPIFTGVILAQKFPGITAALFSETTPSALKTIMSFVIGSPMGYSFPGAAYTRTSEAANKATGQPPQSNPIQTASERAGEAIGNMVGVDEYFDNAILLPPFPWTPSPVPVLIP